VQKILKTKKYLKKIKSMCKKWLKKLFFQNLEILKILKNILNTKKIDKSFKNSWKRFFFQIPEIIV
jgi:hypothetical protein